MKNDFIPIFDKILYDDFINNSSDQKMIDFYFNENFNNKININKDEYYDNYVIFCKTLEYHYLNFLNINIFNNLSNSDDFYLKIKNQKNTISLHLNKIYNFYIDHLITDAINNRVDFFSTKSKNKTLEISFNEYQKTYNKFSNSMKTLLNDFINNYNVFLDVTDFTQAFYNLFDDENFLLNIKNNSIFIEKNNKIYMSDFFINNLCSIFLLEFNTNVLEIEYDQFFLNNFTFLMFNF